MSILDGSPSPLANYDAVYLGLEVIKLGFLAALALFQVRSLESPSNVDAVSMSDNNDG